MKTVGIVGCQPRIGTTTQALQLTLCLMHMGYNAAYVEMGEKDYIEKLDALYQGITIDKNYNILPIHTLVYRKSNRFGEPGTIRLCDKGLRIYRKSRF